MTDADADTDLPQEARRLIATLIQMRDGCRRVGNHKQEREYDEQIRAVRSRYED